MARSRATGAEPRSTLDTTRYSRLQEDFSSSDDEDIHSPVLIVRDAQVKEYEEPFSWFEWSIFFLLGIAMLWAWNMFLAASPYFQMRFADNDRILASFQSAITSVSSVTNLTSMLVLANMQSKASYPKRILSALVINLVIFSLLAISTKYFRGVSPAGYLVFTLIMAFGSSVATGLCQNGAFAFAASFGRPEYLQAIMTGQAVAGVLPSIAQIVTILAIPEPDDYSDAAAVGPAKENTTSAFMYFLTAAAISTLCLLSMMPLIRKHNQIMQNQMSSSISSVEELERSKRKVVSLWTLYKKLHWLAAALFVSFSITMFFPVFTGKIVSIVPIDEAPRILKPNVFIPFGFLVWNIGDLLGRLSTYIPFPAGAKFRRPQSLFLFAVLRSGFVPIYLLCNIENHGAKIKSDIFYLFVQQLLFGITNGWLGSYCMIEFSNFVEEGEREAAGGFMALNLVAGIMCGSFLSFSASGVH